LPWCKSYRWHLPCQSAVCMLAAHELAAFDRRTGG
jgi:hypothetical protein